MSWRDLIETALTSLRQRTFRTILTVLGVLIGTTSVVVMLSLGIGMTQSLTADLKNNPSATKVMVFGNDPYAPATPNKNGKKPHIMNEAEITQLANFPGVKTVTPVYQTMATLRIGKETTQAQLVGLKPDQLVPERFEISEGRVPNPGDGLGLLVGAGIIDQTGTTYDNEGNAHKADIDWLTEQIFLSFDDTFSPEGNQKPGSNKRFLAKATGIVGTPESFTDDSYQIFVDLDKLVNALQQAMPGKALPGQPATEDGKPKGKQFIYSSLWVYAESPDAAEQLAKDLRQEGYDAQSNIEFIRMAQNVGRIVQAVFGGIGAISLLVAAIGIANTMMMSVLERTRQIGIMKVLGASLTDIRNLFLAESAAIGFFGGIIGLIFSYLLSFILNQTLGQSGNIGFGGTQISIIPPWLGLAAIIFSTLIGGLAGLAPAQRAVRLSPLEAIRAQ
uniref:ABC transporter permease n=1 Tax=Vaginimicrobium propionicum TaxID=1871034 RepID=UPI000970FECD|nr:ABC transporter permease [Vaginimicrobium propionicum]